MSTPASAATASVTGLITRDGLGLIRCERCRCDVDATDASVGSVAAEETNSSVLLCSDCARRSDIEAWLVDYLTGPAARGAGCQVA